MDRGLDKRRSLVLDSITGISICASALADVQPVQHEVHICLIGRTSILIAQASVLIGWCPCHSER